MAGFDTLENWLDFRNGERVTATKGEPCCMCGKESHYFAELCPELAPGFEGEVPTVREFLCKTCSDRNE